MRMPFNSIAFLLGFLPLTLVGCGMAARFGSAWVKLWLVGASLLLYGLNAPHDLGLLVACLGLNVALARVMQGGRHNGPIAAVGVVLNLMVLCWFKYAVPLIWPGTSLPPGISFFTFTQIGLLLFLSAPNSGPVGVLEQLLFAAFFPVLLSGPILNPNDMLPGFRRPGALRVTAETLMTGLGFFTIGLIKKAVLADPLGQIVATGFGDPSAGGLAGSWEAALAWYLQLYFDFSGYTDMAIGLGWILGIRLPDNFDQPYRARSIIQYWQRWHMSLTRFLMTNVHTPLTLMVLRRRRRLGLAINGAAQRSAPGFATMIAAPIAATMLLAGVWHGPRASYVLFGLLHAAFLLINHAWRLYRAPVLPRIVSVCVTQAAVLVGAVVFRSETVGGAGRVILAMGGWFGTGMLDIHAAKWAGWIGGLCGVIWCAPTTRQFMQGGAAAWLQWRPTVGTAVAMGCLAALGLLACGGTQTFVYFSF
jgi:D-alanyl-lipoteichoic acid acyltransferase DltB (MBOAT superfamily)